jgi:uncharacterized metal-binding protein YceD (DUF177 family)
MAMKQLPERPWTIPVTVAEIPDDGSHHDLSADPAVRDSVAQLAGLRTLPRLEASFDLSRRGEGVAVRGEVRALAGQTCVVTLEPIESDVRETIDLLFMPVGKNNEDPATAKRKGEPPEPLENGVIDLGAITVEFLVLGLDPYPRKPGVEFSRPEGEDERARPFAALAALKKNL